MTRGRNVFRLKVNGNLENEFRTASVVVVQSGAKEDSDILFYLSFYLRYFPEVITKYLYYNLFRFFFKSWDTYFSPPCTI